MYRHFDFECRKCKSVFEEMISDDSQVLPCQFCKGKADRLLAAPRIDWRRMGLDPAFTTAYEKWGNAKTVHHKTDKGTMHGGKAPNLLMY
jgi:hypothetical protein